MSEQEAGEKCWQRNLGREGRKCRLGVGVAEAGADAVMVEGQVKAGG